MGWERVGALRHCPAGPLGPRQREALDGSLSPADLLSSEPSKGPFLQSEISCPLSHSQVRKPAGGKGAQRSVMGGQSPSPPLRDCRMFGKGTKAASVAGEPAWI